MSRIFAAGQYRCENMGLTGLEPVTLRLSSACSNQLSYRPGIAEVNSDRSSGAPEFRITDYSLPITFWRIGGKGIRTPDFQLAKLALYQLSYAPCEFSILDCESRIANAGSTYTAHPRFRQMPKPDADLINRHPAFVRFFEWTNPRLRARQ